jgi:predicted Zn-ribbon and HTH transcriptional regulator
MIVTMETKEIAFVSEKSDGKTIYKSLVPSVKPATLPDPPPMEIVLDSVGRCRSCGYLYPSREMVDGECPACHIGSKY